MAREGTTPPPTGDTGDTGHPPHPPLAGSLLLAHPTLNEGVFRHAVILLPAHDENGSLGIVLNQPLHKRVGEISSEFALGPLSDVPIFNGGPVAPDKLVFCAWRVHEQGIGLQLIFGLDPEKAMSLQYQQGMHLRAFFGYAGWDAGQLERELRQNTWIVMPLLPNLLEETNDNAGAGDALWRKILGKLGPRWRVMAGEPDDPKIN
jgi:putative transcriptional regulator